MFALSVSVVSIYYRGLLVLVTSYLLWPVPAMVGHHVVAGSVAEDYGSLTYVTIRPSRMERYSWGRAVGAFDWPMDAMERLAGIEELDYDALLARFQSTGRPFWIARIWKNYGGLLDMHVRFSYPDRVYYYILDFPADQVAIGPEYDGWPQPRDFYLARAAIPTSTSWTIAEYNTVNPGSMPPAGSTDEAMEPETMPAADEAMPAVGVAMETSGSMEQPCDESGSAMNSKL